MAPHRTVRAVLAWPTRSQQRACRNALVASTALTRRRVEREEVEEFLRAHHRRWEVRNHPEEPARVI